ncbi:MAG TPA: peptidoglycan-binding domain-containing protein [Crinalium sp.]|jgi:hypothetical protein
MSDPTTLLLLACVSCHSGTTPTIKIEPVPCPQADGQNPEGLNQTVSTCVSSPEPIALTPEMGDRTPKSVSQPEFSYAVSTDVELPLSRTGGDRIRPFNIPDAPSLLGQGSQGETVEQVQIRLQRLGYYNGAIDGQYGPNTSAGVRQFQQVESLPTTGDVNAVTWARLRRSSEADLSASTVDIKAIQRENQHATVPKRDAFSQDDFLVPAPPPLPKDTPEYVEPSVSKSPESSQMQRRVVLEQPDAAPSSMTFYLWLLAWAVIYLGGFVVIFLTGDSPFKQVWLSKFQFNRRKTATPSAIAINQLTIDKEPLPEQPDVPSVPNLPQQPDVSSPIGRSDASEDEVPVVWTDDVLAPLSQEFSNLMGLLGHLSAKDKLEPKPELKRELTEELLETVDVSDADHDVQPVVGELSIPSTLIGILSASEPDTGMDYTYLLLDDADGSFLLRDNELRIRNDVLYSIKKDTDFVVKVRRIDANGEQFDESLTLHLGIPEMPTVEDDMEQLASVG